MKTKIKKSKIIPKDEWGVALHMALRKICDSHQTTIAYIAIDNMSNESWGNYLDHLKKYCTGSVESLKSSSLSWNYYNNECINCHFAKILGISFKMFTDSDWKGYQAFLEKRE